MHGAAGNSARVTPSITGVRESGAAGVTLALLFAVSSLSHMPERLVCTLPFGRVGLGSVRGVIVGAIGLSRLLGRWRAQAYGVKNFNEMEKLMMNQEDTLQRFKVQLENQIEGTLARFEQRMDERMDAILQKLNRIANRG